MDITLDKKNATEAVIKIKLKETDYQLKVEEKIKDYKKKANIKGFRPGKVPTSLIKQMYGTSILVDEVNHLLSHSLTDYIRENKIQILGEPMPKMTEAGSIDWNTQKDFDFEYEIGMVDKVDYDLSKKVKVTSYEIEVDEKTMNETLDNVKKQFGVSTNPEISEEGDSVYGTLKSEDGEIEHDSTVSISAVEKKEQKKFIGLKKDDEVSFDIRKAIKEDSVIGGMLGKSIDEAKDINGKFQLTVKNINRIEPAEINQELFDKVFPQDEIKNESDFLEKIKSTISGNYVRETDQFLQHSVQDALMAKTKIDLPDEFLKRWLLQANKGVTAEQVEQEYDMYVKELKWSLISNKIAEDNEIKVEHEDVIDQTKTMILQQLSGSGMAGMEANMDMFVDNYLKGENGDNYTKVFNQVKVERVLDLVKDKISITSKKVDVDGFSKAVEKTRV